MARLSRENFEYYKEESKYWLKFLGIYQWDARFVFEKDDQALARVTWSFEDGIATFYLALRWGKDEINNYNLSKTAFHEVGELLLAELNDMARRDTRDSLTNAAVHEVIRRLENTVFEYEWSRRQVS